MPYNGCFEQLGWLHLLLWPSRPKHASCTTHECRTSSWTPSQAKCGMAVVGGPPSSPPTCLKLILSRTSRLSRRGVGRTLRTVGLAVNPLVATQFTILSEACAEYSVVLLYRISLIFSSSCSQTAYIYAGRTSSYWPCLPSHPIARPAKLWRLASSQSVGCILRAVGVDIHVREERVEAVGCLYVSVESRDSFFWERFLSFFFFRSELRHLDL